MIRTILIDDEKKLIDVLQFKLEELCPQVEVVGYAQNATDAFELIHALRPDLIFLDIAMPRETGFDLLDKFSDIFFEIVFVTSYDQYAVKAFKRSAVDYLLKPLDSAELVSAVSKVQHRLETKTTVSRYDILLSNLSQDQNKDKTIVIPDHTSYKFVKESQIVRCEGWQKYTKVYTSFGETFLSSHSIGHYKNLLSENLFFHTHRSHIINVEYLDSYNIDGSILMKDKSIVPVSRNKRQEFKDRFLG